MPAYNHKRYIEKAILSIVTQTFQDFELIVINDGSTDNTGEILDRLQAKYGFKLIHQENAGLTKTLNRLIRLAEGKFITGCASDDYWPPTRLEEQVQCLHEHPEVDLVHGKFTTVDNEDKLVPNGGFKGNPIEGPNEFPQFVRRKRSYLTGTIMVRAEAFHRVGFYDENIAVEDFDWMLRATRILNIKFVPSSWTFYRRHGENWGMTQKGAARMADSSYQEARKLGLYWGSVFLFYKSPQLLKLESKARRKHRFLFILFLPLLIVNFRFTKELIKKSARRISGREGVPIDI